MNSLPLKNALQMLALPITAQVRLDANDCGRVERLRGKFKEGRRQLLSELNAQLSIEQNEILRRIDNILSCVNPGDCWLDWTEKRLRQDSNWRRVRTCARIALIKFNWPLEIPAGEEVVFHPNLHHCPALAQPRCLLPNAC